MKIKAYVTDKYQGYRLSEVDLTTEQKALQINYDKDVTYQTWLGFGGAFTESACFVLSKASEDVKNAVLNEYFGKNGIGYTLARIPVASCDFSLSPYDYLETGKLDYQRDEKYLMPIIKEALKLTNLTFLASPWSPPSYMKTNGKRNFGGSLKKEFYEEYADYYVAYLKHLLKEGLDVKYLSIQNEPAATQTWDSCIYTPLEEFSLAKILKAKLVKDSMDINILVWDHNRDIMVERLMPVYENDVDNIIYGAGIHWYDNEPYQNIAKIKELYPLKHIMHTEGCIEGGPHYNYFEGLERYARNIIEDMNHGTEAFIDWNLCLDEFGGPNWVGNFCDAPIMMKDGYTKQYSFYGIAHLSKFIKPGMERIQITNDFEGLYITAFKDNKKVIIVILNEQEEDFTINLNYLTKQLIKRRSLTTLIVEDEDE